MGTYKTNWKLTETVMPEDFNRIEENIKENNKNHNDFKIEYDKTLKEQNKKIDNKSEKSDVVLKIPQRLPAKTDLNTVVKGGNYVVVENTPNSPISCGRLVVYQWDASVKWITQVLYSDITNEVYTRCSTNDEATSWTPWKKLISTSEADNKYLNKNLGNVSDFNLCKTEGIYNVQAENILNAPFKSKTKIYGKLTVYVRDRDITQMFISHENRIFLRFCNTGESWKNWTKIFSTYDIPSWNDIKDKPNFDVKYFTNYVDNVSDFNNCKTEDKYYLQTSRVIPNAPYSNSGTIKGTLLVYKNFSDIIQVFMDDLNNIVTRYYSNDTKTWRNWTKMITEKEFTSSFESKNDSTSGYQKLPNGTLIQWGSTIIKFDGYRAHGYLYYPIAFKEYAHCTGNVASNSYGGYCETTGTVASDNLTRGYAEALDFESKNENGKNVRIQWIAIGR